MNRFSIKFGIQMNVQPTKVYRELKMRTIFLLLLLPVQSLFAQIDYMPFELERLPPSQYQSIISNQDTSFISESDALTYYFIAYKIQRSENPASYFPEPDQKRKRAATYLNANYPHGAGLALVHFLESSGNQTSCNEILNSNSDFRLLLAYRFIAAELTQNKEEARNALEAMNSENMLSPVLKAFGENAVASFGDKKIVVTQGIQDLIAVSYALSPDSKIEIRNVFLEQCSTFAGRPVKSIVQNHAQKLWIAPTVDVNHLESSENIHLQGVGFVFTSDTENLANNLSTVGLNFQGADDAAQSPADRGLIRSYRYFSNTFSEYSDQFGSKKEKKAAEAINLFVKQSDK